jgi:hypothetical protein
MEVNVDTYVLPENSNSFLSEVLPTSNPLRITWEVLTDKEKEGYLASSLRNLEAINYIGEKVWSYQDLKFPRIARGRPPEFEEAPKEVKRAQVYWAAVIANDELYINRRNNDACLALGLISAETKEVEGIPRKVKELLQKWTTNWRKV